MDIVRHYHDVAVGSLRRQAVLVEAAGLQNHRQVLALAGQQFDILDRIAVDDEDIGEGARLHHAELAGHTQNFGAYERGLANDLDRRQNLAAEQEFAALVDLQLAEKIAAVSHWHAGTFAYL